jgi:hypothetical protein
MREFVQCLPGASLFTTFYSTQVSGRQMSFPSQLLQPYPPVPSPNPNRMYSQYKVFDELDLERVPIYQIPWP